MVIPSELTAIVTAGGKGIRLPGEVRKQYLEFGGKPLLALVIGLFVAFDPVDQIVVTVPAEDIPMVKDMIRRIYQQNASLIRVIAGGATRQESVHNALRICPSETGYVMIHDGVRPFVTTGLLRELYRKVKRYKAVIPVTEAKYTIKEVEKTRVVRTLDRNRLVQVNTPQAFTYQLIRSCYDRASTDRVAFTDDASVVEFYGHPVYTVSDSGVNIKLTTAIDLAIMEVMFTLFDEVDSNENTK